MELPFKLRFLVLPDFIYSDNRLNATDIKVYSFINSYKGDKFYFTNEQMGEMFGVSVTTISTSVSRLTKFGYIETAYQIKSDGGKIRFIVNSRHQEVLKSDFKKTSRKTLQLLKDKDNKIKVNNTFTKVNDTRSNGLKLLKDVLEERKLKIPLPPTDNRIKEGWQHYAHEVVELAGFKNGGRARIFDVFKKKNYGHSQVQKAKQVVVHKNFIALTSEKDKASYLIGAFKNP